MAMPIRDQLFDHASEFRAARQLAHQVGVGLRPPLPGQRMATSHVRMPQAMQARLVWLLVLLHPGPLLPPRGGAGRAALNVCNANLLAMQVIWKHVPYAISILSEPSQ
ncbi:MAG TPA: hypothetical protein VKZ53_13585 [Candidatus Angelobacter sp.]|nr:hypothetical protein [Candidatus Angelobacter sp.]